MTALEILIGPISQIINKLIPDKAAAAQAQLELLKLQQAGELKELDAIIALGQQQSDVNKVEAASTDPFTSRWRPFIGWVCGTGLAVQFVVSPLVTWGTRLAGHPVDFPALDMGTLLTLLLGMLGLGGMRTVEKIKGAA